MYKLLKKTLLILLGLAPALAFAADGNPAEGFSLNPVRAALVSLILFLLVIISFTTHVLLQLVAVYRERLRKERKKTGGTATALLTAMVLLSLPATAAEEAVAASPAYISGIAEKEFYTLIAIIVLELVVLFSLLLNIRLFTRLSMGKAPVAKTKKAKVRMPLLDRFNKSVAVDEETDIMLDHEYDGIRELDNNLPPWWKYGFYLTIVISVIYMWYYHVGGGPSSHDEYIAEVQRAEAEVAAYLAATSGNIDESNVTIVEDQAELAGAIKIYQTACAACHANDGGGTIGPNLTDPYWLHGGNLSDIFKSIKYGYPDKGMKSWKDDYSPKQLAALASYIMNMQGTTPANPKEPQGALHTSGTAQTEPAQAAPEEKEAI